MRCWKIVANFLELTVSQASEDYRIARKDLSENGWHFNFIKREDEQDE